MVSKGPGHRHLLPFGEGSGGQVEVSLDDLDGLLLAWCGAGVVIPRIIQGRQVAQAVGVVGVSLPEHLLAERQSLPCQRKGLARLAGPIEGNNLVAEDARLGAFSPTLRAHPRQSVDVIQGTPGISDLPVSLAD